MKVVQASRQEDPVTQCNRCGTEYESCEHLTCFAGSGGCQSCGRLPPYTYGPDRRHGPDRCADVLAGRLDEAERSRATAADAAEIYKARCKALEAERDELNKALREIASGKHSAKHLSSVRAQQRIAQAALAASQAPRKDG